MTDQDFLKRHMEAFRELRRTPLWKDLIEATRSSDPARAMPKVEAKSATDNAEHLLGRIAGFNLAVNLWEIGFQEEISTEPLDANYQPDEEEPK